MRERNRNGLDTIPAGLRRDWVAGRNSADRADAGGLPDQVCDESAGEAHHKDGCGCHGHQVNGPRVVAFAHKVEVPRAAFVSI
jgi:hypothetical protein